jgi:RNA recognition motif-containing protein
MSKIYVGNLPFSANEDAVRQLFAQHGTVDSVAIINDRDTVNRAASASSK